MTEPDRIDVLRGGVLRCEHTIDGRTGGWHHHGGSHACDWGNHDDVCRWEAREDELALQPRPRWADERPEALQELADPSIKLAGGEELSHRWALPAGWVRLVNGLHADLVDLLGEYEVLKVGQKSGGLLYSIDRVKRADGGPDVRDDVTERIRAARAESFTVCEVCGGAATDARSVLSTRCEDHPIARPHRVPSAVARPPGWSPDR